MLQICGLVLYFCQLVLGIFFYFGSNMAKKCIKFFQAFFQKDLEFILDQKNKLVVLNASLMLLLAIENVVFQEVCSKKYVLIPLGSNSLKIDFTLFTEIVAFYIQFTIVKIKVSAFERPVKVVFWLCCYQCLDFSLLNIGLYKVSEQYVSRNQIEIQGGNKFKAR